MVNFGPLTAEICWRVWGTPTNFNGFCVLAALLHGTLVVGVSQTLRRWTQGATYIRQGGHYVGHWPTFLVLSIFYLLLFFSSPPAVALHAAGLKYRTQNIAKIRHLRTIAQLCRVISSQLRHTSTIGKTAKQQYLPHMTLQYGELRPTSGWDLLASLGHPAKFKGFSVLAMARHSSSGRQPNFAALNRGRHLYTAGRPSRRALPTF